jgi:hypothetical protein
MAFDRLEAEKKRADIRADRTDIPMDPEQAQTCGQAVNPAFSEDGLLDHMFRYHPPYGNQVQKYSTLRESARHFAKTILMNVPAGADRTAALRKVREAVMTANAGIACDGVSF